MECTTIKKEKLLDVYFCKECTSNTFLLVCFINSTFTHNNYHFVPACLLIIILSFSRDYW